MRQRRSYPENLFRIETIDVLGWKYEMGQQSNSQYDNIGFWERVPYLFGLLRMHIARLWSNSNFDGIVGDVRFYENALKRYVGKPLGTATAFEVGYGQRPFRLIALNWIGVNAVGVDLDEPIYALNVQRVVGLIKRNGFTRALKSLIRRVFFDPSEYRKLSSVLGRSFGRGLPFNANRLLIGDASREETWTHVPESLDLIISEDVFEHIPADRIAPLLATICQHMRKDSLAIITPMVFTGISGGHDLDWYLHRVYDSLDGRTAPWGHLTGDAKPADTFLNKLKRSDYRDLFRKHFDILEEVELQNRMGAVHLTKERREKLAEYSDEDLFSNQVRFVLRKR